MVNLRSFALCLLVAAPAVAGAQTKITLRPTPKPQQTLHVMTTQEFSISMDPGPTAPGVQVLNKVAFDFTQSNGTFDDQDRMESRLVIDRIEVEEVLNGAKKTPDDAAKFVGQSLTAVFDRAGKLVAIKLPKSLEQSSARLRTPIATAYGALSNFPATALAVGETATVPWDIPLRLPGSTAQGPLKVQAVITLRAIEKRGDDRIAHFDQRIEAPSEPDQLKVAGTGTVDLNLDRGFIEATATEWTVVGSYRQKGSPADAQPSNVRATLKMTMTAKE